ncbi:DegT/DnrJ/EryC1/StrS aminotransferase [Staphylococcus ursi]|uniref:DegT/DnrJ/EryC1/StrS family aminotransferase n=1 Tax=Staphylococcus sp. MI 10-1553 TaxID=1912064 RepID=UPI0013992AD1|nr:DegT/DnrJ/EryC1/StrS family aminotransferase [Staphylococcus sp. MI 10-1553]QHW35916.1 DegT/DnrJ/EryC1/StrS aminotransferase [Staphylococcus sp. MI 10-1553]
MQKLAMFGGHPIFNEKIGYVWPVFNNKTKIKVLDMIDNNEISFNYKDDEIYKLEQNFKNLFEVPYCIALNSGTSAIYTFFKAIDLQENDEVIAPTYTFPASIMPLCDMKVNLKLIDTIPDFPITSLDKTLEAVSEKTKLIIVTHMDGFPFRVDILKSKLNELGLNPYILEDCAQSFGAKINDRYVGTFGDASIFSLQQKKLLSGGEGGVILLRDRYLYEKSILISYLQKRAFSEVKNSSLSMYRYVGLGHNFRIHPFSAGIVNTQLSSWKYYIELRKNNLERLYNILSDIPEIKVLKSLDDSTDPSYFTFKMLYTAEKKLNIDKYVEALNAEGLDISASSTIPLHTDEGIIKIFDIKNAEDLKNSEKYSKNILRMPAYHSLTENELHLIYKAFLKISKNIDILKRKK